MKTEVEKAKITVVCNVCGKPFTTNIGWAAKKGKNLTCSKCGGDKIKIADDIDVIEAINILKKSGIKVQ